MFGFGSVLHLISQFHGVINGFALIFALRSEKILVWWANLTSDENIPCLFQTNFQFSILHLVLLTAQSVFTSYCYFFRENVSSVEANFFQNQCQSTDVIICPRIPTLLTHIIETGTQQCSVNSG